MLVVCSHLDFLFLSFLTIVGLNQIRNPSSIVHYLITFLAAYLIPFLCVTHYGLLFLSMPICQRQVFHERKKKFRKKPRRGEKSKKKRKEIRKDHGTLCPGNAVIREKPRRSYLVAQDSLICWTIHVYEDFGNQSDMGHLMKCTFLNVRMASK